MITATEGAEFQFIGEIPADWEIVRVRRITQEHKQGYYTEQPYVEEGVKLVRITDIDDFANVSFENMPFVAISSKEEQDFKVQNNDFLFARSGTIGRFGLVKSPERSVFASYLIRFRFKGADSEFLRFVFSSYFFKEGLISTLHGGANKNINAENIKEQLIAIPPPELQIKIASFLERKTAAIDTLIFKKQRLIQLLEEKRTALINQAVTKGLNPNAPMKNSGIPWIVEIPEHWHVCELRRKWKVIDCKHKTPEYIDSGYPLVSTTEVKPGKIDLSIITRYISEEDFFDMTENRLPKRGDIIYSRNASLGSAAYVDTEELFAMGQDVVLITSQTQDQLFLSYYLNSQLGILQVELACVGSTFRRINVGQIKQILITIPPIQEQVAIGQQLERITALFEKNISLIGEQIEKLQDYRRSLITAAVTGKLNIGEEKAV